jgi:hypothetical protein
MRISRMPSIWSPFAEIHARRVRRARYGNRGRDHLVFGAVRVDFLVPAGQSLSCQELADALAAEMAAQGTDTGVFSGGDGAGSRLIVVASRSIERVPDGALWALVCIAPPQTPAFEEVWRTAGRARIVYDVSPAGVAEWRRRGIPARRLEAGYSSAWDHRRGEERDVDICVLGSLTDHRARVVATLAPLLTPYRTQILLGGVTSTNPLPATATIAGAAKLDILSRTRVLIEVPDREGGEPDWLNVAEAVSNGCAVVAEAGPDYGRLRPGREFLTGPAGALGELAVGLLENPTEWGNRSAAAEKSFREQHSLAEAARQLATDLGHLSRRAMPIAKPVDGLRRLSWRAAAVAGAVKSTPHRLAARLVVAKVADQMRGQEDQLASVLAALKDIRLDLVDARRHWNGLGAEGGREEEPVTTPAFPDARPAVSVLVTLYNYAQYVAPALESTLGDDSPPIELIVVDDASTDGSAEVVLDWFERHPHIPAKLVRHPVNQGLPAARNRATAEARAPLVFILDADNLILPGGLRRLMEALSRDPDAAFAYGILRTFDANGPTGLLSFYPWDPEVLAHGNYIDAMALIRRDVLERLGGYGTDRRLHGLEDYDLWRRIATVAGRGAFVPEVVGEYRVSRSSMLRSLTAISTEVAEAVIDERCRELRDAPSGRER